MRQILPKTLVDVLLPLSEEGAPIFAGERELIINEQGTASWDEYTKIAPFERRTIGVTCRVGQGGQGRMIRLFFVPKGARLTINHHIRLDDGASWDSTVVIAGEGEVKIRRLVECLGSKSRATLGVLSLMRGEGRLITGDEIHLLGAAAEAIVTARSLAADASQVALRGRITVGQLAKSAKAREELHALVLGPAATAEVLPELETGSMNASCSHAGSVVPLPAEALFYAASRGAAPERAVSELVRGFFAPLIATLPTAMQEEADCCLFGSL